MNKFLFLTILVLLIVDYDKEIYDNQTNMNHYVRFPSYILEKYEKKLITDILTLFIFETS